MTLPNFLIIGAGKAGTTSLQYYLKQHPQIAIPAFEPNFFALEGEEINFKGPTAHKFINKWSVNDIGEYCNLFKGISNKKVAGEKSPLYLYSPNAPKRIKKYAPDVKLIAILRNPVERAYSAYSFMYGAGIETIPNFARALKAEEKRIKNNWEWIYHYQNMGFYYRQLKRYFDIFDKSQIKVYLYEDFKENPIGLLQDIFHFLDVDDTFIPDMSRKKIVTYKPKCKFLHELIFFSKPIRTVIKNILKFSGMFEGVNNIRDNLIRWNSGGIRPAIAPEIRKQLIGEYREDILKLETLIKKNLSGWLKC